MGETTREIWVWTGIDPASLAYEWIWQPCYTVDGIYYWAGMVFITLLVLGSCNAANLIDGLDGLLSGSVGIMAAGFVAVAVILAIVDHPESGPAPNLAEAEAIEAVRAVELARGDPAGRAACHAPMQAAISSGLVGTGPRSGSTGATRLPGWR